MYHIFYSPIYEALEDEQSTATDIDPQIDDSQSQVDDSNLQSNDMGEEPEIQNQDASASPDAQMQNPPPDQTQTNNQDDLVTKFQKYLLFLKLKDLQYKISLTEYKDNSEFKELTVLLKLILEFFSIFKYDQIFTLTNMLIDKFSKIKLEKNKK